MSGFNYDKDADGIVTITMDMSGPVNAMNEEFGEAMDDVLDRLGKEEGLTGVVLASAKKVFFAGGDLNVLLAVKKGAEAPFMAYIEKIKAQMRALEKLPVPVVVAINGAALGGGLELCLACNYRIAYNHKSVELGLPEVTLGLLPGGGGIVRLVNLIGLEPALPYLLEGKRVHPETALASGIIDELVNSIEALIPAAKTYLRARRDDPDAAIQPWDRKGHKIPGGNANSPKVAQVITLAPPMIFKKTRGLLPSPGKVLDCAVQAVRLDFDTALKVETRGLLSLVVTPQCKNMITTFFQMNKIKGGANRPKGIEPTKVKKVGILGAGMMGQGIAYASAMAGIQVILKDINIAAAEKGKAYSETLLAHRVARGRMDENQKQAVLDLILPSENPEDLQGCDLIIEAVFENIALKNQVTETTETYLAETGIWGTNTSSLPVSTLAQASKRPESFVGIHFFSPVDKMPLIEIIKGELTSDETLARAYDYARQIRKTPIIVNDSLGFFATRTFITYVDEGARLLTEGLHPVLIESLGKALGMPVGPLAVHDETSLELSRKMQETWKEMGVQDQLGDHSIVRRVVDTLIGEYGRGGRFHGGGFYEYPADGDKHIWPELFALYHNPDYEIPDQDIKDRLLFRQVIETLKCLEEGVLRSVPEGNIGSLMGIGAPVWTGGFIQFVNTYGLDKFIARCGELAGKYGDRFKAPAIAGEKLAAGELLT